MAGYIPKRFTCPRAVTHPSSNRAQCRLTALIELNALTITLRRHQSNSVLPHCPALKLFSVTHCYSYTYEWINDDSILPFTFVYSFVDFDISAPNTSCNETYVMIGPEPCVVWCGSHFPRIYTSARHYVTIAYVYRETGAPLRRGFILKYFTSLFQLCVLVFD